MKYLFLLTVCLLYSGVQAVEIRHARADVDDNRYRVDMDIVIQAPLDRVYAILTDYTNYHELNESFIESVLLERSDSTHSKIRLVSESCVLLFCFNAVFIYFIEESEGTQIMSRIDPDSSDFNFGESRLHLNEIDDNQTDIRFYSLLQPSFWIPPLIGPWLLKSRILEEVNETFEKVEAIAQKD